MANKKIEIIVGTSENYLVGYKVDVQKNGELSFNIIFAERAHSACIRQLCVSGKYLASGGADEMIKLYDLYKSRDLGWLEKHEGTVTSLAFHKTNYLFSGSEDGKICIYKTAGFKCEKTLFAHPGGVTCISVHPTGKLALSVGNDKKLCTWNLIKGRRAYVTHVGVVAEIVLWNPTGVNFLVVKGSAIDIYEVSNGKVKQSVDFKERIQALVFITEDIVAVGGEGKNICLYDITNQIEIVQWPAHSLRIKSLKKIARTAVEEVWLVSASTDGFIKVWKLELLSLQKKPKLIGKVDISCRITCMDIRISRQKVTIKKEEEGEEEAKDANIEKSGDEEEEDDLDDEDDIEDEEDKEELEGEVEGLEKLEDDSDSQESYLEEDDLEEEDFGDMEDIKKGEIDVNDLESSEEEAEDIVGKKKNDANGKEVKTTVKQKGKNGNVQGKKAQKRKKKGKGKPLSNKTSTSGQKAKKMKMK
ncbi:p21-activated protein kinase-interacting protein 1-like [Penaeus chinensis]|uniref:p21-activated protein kinase-interacting protein 1-like n=1 Tax=Penaeus chinensis TaxID=139456 RepID=UPI001FB73D2C|nr:p21-activated protein kinase-interacting protein 1-like [Penaeus chinensis]